MDTGGRWGDVRCVICHKSCLHPGFHKKPIWFGDIIIVATTAMRNWWGKKKKKSRILKRPLVWGWSGRWWFDLESFVVTTRRRKKQRRLLKSVAIPPPLPLWTVFVLSPIRIVAQRLNFACTRNWEFQLLWAVWNAGFNLSNPTPVKFNCWKAESGSSKDFNVSSFCTYSLHLRQEVHNIENSRKSSLVLRWIYQCPMVLLLD